MTVVLKNLHSLIGWLTKVLQMEVWREKHGFQNGGPELNAKKLHYPMWASFLLIRIIFEKLHHLEYLNKNILAWFFTISGKNDWVVRIDHFIFSHKQLTNVNSFKHNQGKFSATPIVLASADHVSSAYKHDAASLWIENATSSSFYICIRELQNYDGLHEDIFVVCGISASLKHSRIDLSQNS